jgi:glycosyltransferase involved in cell wall biosynthesis
VRIVIDLQGAQSPSTQHRGIGRYSVGLTEAIIRNRGNHDVHLLLNAAFPETVASIREHFLDLIPADRIHVFDVVGPVPIEPGDPRRITSEMCREALLGRLDPDVVHISSLIEGMESDAVASIGRLGLDVPTSVSFYDAIPLIYRSQYLSDPARAARYDERLEQLRLADLPLAISKSSASEAIEHLGIDPGRIVNIGAAADPVFQPANLEDEDRRRFLARFGIVRPFVMYTGGIDFRKNIEGLIQAFAALPRKIRAEHQLVVACECSPADQSRLLNLSKRLSLRDDVFVLTGRLQTDELVRLYSLTKLFVFPSLHEGFGLPALEAMQCGAPVIGSDRSSIPEVIDRADALFDPRDVSVIRDALLTALADTPHLDRLRHYSAERAGKFSWDDVGKRAIGAFEDLHRSCGAARASRPHTAKPRMAYVSPLPPAQSGVATYSRDLLPHLAAYYDIDVVVEWAFQADRVPGASKIIDAQTFLTRATSYDRVIYQVGNSGFHDYMLRLLEAVPGMVVLHDFHLGGLIRHSSVGEGGEPAWLSALYRAHGAGAVLDTLGESAPNDIAAVYPLSTTVVGQSFGAIVHSAYAESLAADWLSPDALRRISRVPLPRTTPPNVGREEARRRLNFAEDSRLICSFGLLGPTKCNLELLAAWTKSTAFQNDRSKLVFVGEASSPGYCAALRERISEAGLSDRVTITGWVDDDTYRDYLSACDLAVQLRKGSRGEASLTLLDCLAYGAPTIANAHGSNLEVSNSAISILPDSFDEAQLRDAIDWVEAHPQAARAMGEAAHAYVEKEHSPRETARRYRDQIEQRYGRTIDLPKALSPYAAELSVDDALRLADIAFQATYVPPALTIHLDVSELSDSNTPRSRKRVLSGALLRLVEASPRAVRIELIRYDDRAGLYLKAQSALAELLSLDAPLGPDEPTDVVAGDIILCLDSRQEAVSQRAETLERLQLLGTRLFFLLDDLRGPTLRDIPVERISENFDAWLALVAKSSGAFCSSDSLTDELTACLSDKCGSHLRVTRARGWLTQTSDSALQVEAMRTIFDRLTAASAA